MFLLIVPVTIFLFTAYKLNFCRKKKIIRFNTARECAIHDSKSNKSDESNELDEPNRSNELDEPNGSNELDESSGSSESSESNE